MSYKNYLAEREARLRILERKSYKDSLVQVEASSAFIECTLRVMESNNEEAKTWWRERLNLMERVIDENVKLHNEIEVLEWEYKKLYSKYSEMVEINRRLEKDFDRNEMTNRRLQDEF